VLDGSVQPSGHPRRWQRFPKAFNGTNGLRLDLVNMGHLIEFRVNLDRYTCVLPDAVVHVIPPVGHWENVAPCRYLCETYYGYYP
jgi:hypothetical protein